MARDEKRVTEYAERTAAVLIAAGFPKMPARVLMALTVAETGLTAAELAERLGVSAAAISGAVRYVQTIGMLRRVSQPGSRRDLYVLPENPWYAASMSETRVYDPIIESSEAMLDALGGVDTVAGMRVAEMVDFMRFFKRRLPELLEEWRRQRADG